MSAGQAVGRRCGRQHEAASAGHGRGRAQGAAQQTKATLPRGTAYRVPGWPQRRSRAPCAAAALTVAAGHAARPIGAFIGARPLPSPHCRRVILYCIPSLCVVPREKHKVDALQAQRERRGAPGRVSTATGSVAAACWPGLQHPAAAAHREAILAIIHCGKEQQEEDAGGASALVVRCGPNTASLAHAGLPFLPAQRLTIQQAVEVH